MPTQIILANVVVKQGMSTSRRRSFNLTSAARNQPVGATRPEPRERLQASRRLSGGTSASAI
jgi:hypothetical protein